MKKSSLLIDYLILCAVFISPFKDLVVLSVGIIDFKLPQLLWFLIFGVLLIKKIGTKDTRASIVNLKEVNNNLLFCLYICVLVISCIFSVNIIQSIKEFIQYIYMFIAMYIIYIKSKDKAFMDSVIKAIILSNVIMVVVILISVASQRCIIPAVTIFSDGYIFLDSELYSTQSLVETGTVIKRINILGIGPIGVSFYTILQSLLINYKIRQSKGRTRIVLLLLLCANVAVVVMGYSRIGILLFFGLNVITLFGKDPLKNAGIIILTVFGAFVFLSNTPELFHRIMETFNTEELSTRYHFAYWLIALKTGYSNILTGIGLGNVASVQPEKYAYVFDQFNLYITPFVPTHNFILQIWSEQGIIGLLINLVMLVTPLVYFINARYIRKTIPAKSMYYYMVLGYIGALIYNLTNNSFYIESFWEYIGLMYAMKYHVSKEGRLFDGCRLINRRETQITGLRKYQY